jgi:spermidine synthase
VRPFAAATDTFELLAARHRCLILLAYAASGAAALAYELLWHRGLALVIGSTTAATAATLVGFLGGLALGSRLAAPAAERVRQPLRVYAAVELAIAACGWLLAQAWAASPALAALTWRLSWQTALDPLVVRFGVAAAVLLVPTALMGATFPLIAASRPASEARSETNWIPAVYALNTLGAVVGAIAAGFVGLPTLGARGTTVLAMGLNALAAAAALGAAQTTPAPSSRRSAPAGPIDSRLPPLRAAQPMLVWLILPLSAAVTLGLEVVWTRVLTLVLGSSTYAFATMVSTFVGGLAVGALVAARMVTRLARPAEALGWGLVATAGGALLALHVVPWLPVAFLYTFRLTGGDWLLLAMGMSVLAATVMLPTAVTQGLVFPLGTHVVTTGHRDPARRAGVAYAVATVGAVAGALVTTFTLIPTWGLDGAGAALVVLSLIGAGVAMLAAGPRGTWRLTRAVVSTTLVLALWFPDWDPLRLATGVYRDAPRLLELYPSPAEFPRMFRHYRLVWFRDGTGATVLVYERPSHGAAVHRVLTIDGKVEASTAEDMSTQVLLGHLPWLVGARPGRALVVGLASGITLGSLARHPFDAIVAVELEPAVVAAAAEFRQFNHHVLADPRVRLLVEDGRIYLAAPGTEFDVIVSEPSNPWIAGSARLFTVEFFRLARRRLAPDGVFVQWIQLYGLTPSLLRIAVRTFLAVFPEALAFQAGPGDLLLVGAGRPVRLDYRRLVAAFEHAAVAGDLARAGLRDPAALAARLLLGGEQLRQYAGRGVLNTDENALLEFGAGRALYRETTETNLQSIEQYGPPNPIRYLDGLPPGSRGTMARRIAEVALRAGEGRRAYHAASWAVSAGGDPESWWLLGEAAQRQGKTAEARRAWRQVLTSDPRHTRARLGLARLAWREGNLPEAQELLDPALDEGDGLAAAWHLGGWLAARRNVPALAVRRFQRALSLWEDVRDRWVVRYGLAQSLRQVGEEAAAAAEESAMKTDLRAWCALLEQHPPSVGAGGAELETGAILDALAADRGGISRAMLRHVVEPLTHFYRGRTLYLLGYDEDAAMELQQAVRLGGCEAARQLLTLVETGLGRRP